MVETFDDAEPEARDDRAQDRAHATNDDDGEDDDDEVAAHLRVHRIDRCGEHAREGGQRDARAVVSVIIRGTLMPKAWTSLRGSPSRPQIGADLGLLDHQPGGQAHDDGDDDDPAAIDRHEQRLESQAP